MKRYTLFGLLLIFTTSFTTLSAQSWMWGREAKPISQYCGGDPNPDHTAATDNYGNTYIAGPFYDTLVFGRDTALSNIPAQQGDYVVKYDSNGKVHWAKLLAHGTIFITSIAWSRDGGVYTTGYFNDTAIIGSDTLKTGIGSQLFLVKCDTAGTVIWARQSRGDTVSGNPSLATDMAGNAYITGVYLDTILFGGIGLFTNAATGNMFLVKYDKSGNVKWATQGLPASSASAAAGISIATDRIGYPIVTGNFSDTVTMGAFTLKETLPGNALFIARYNPAGTPVWVRQSATPGLITAVNPASISVDGAGCSYILGSFNDSASFGTYTVYQVEGNIFVVKYDSTGKVRWVAQANDLNGNNWSPYSIVSDTTSEGGGFFAASGYGGSPFLLKFQADTFSFNNLYSQASVLIRFDSGGKTLCGSIFTEGGEDDDDAVTVDRSGRYIYFAGDLQSSTIFGPDTLVYGGDVPFVCRWVSCENKIIHDGVDDNAFNGPTAILYPNPNQGNFTIKLQGLKGTCYAEIYNILGERVYASKLTSSINHIEIGNISEGIYLFRIQTESGELAGEGKFIIQ